VSTAALKKIASLSAKCLSRFAWHLRAALKRTRVKLGCAGLWLVPPRWQQQKLTVRRTAATAQAAAAAAVSSSMLLGLGQQQQQQQMQY
jgi:uncharacterized membrane protein YgdD (TMEM256/DUF423 family)